MALLDYLKENFSVIILTLFLSIAIIWGLNYIIAGIFHLKTGLPSVVPILRLGLVVVGIPLVVAKYLLGEDLSSIKTLIVAALAIGGIVLLSMFLPNLVPAEFAKSMSLLPTQAMSLLGT